MISRIRARRRTALALATCVSVVSTLAALPLGSADAAARAGACGAGQVALTFDDGPSTQVTPGLVRTLRAKNVPATFFMVGSRVKAAPTVARLVERAGFLVANHSYAHQSMTTQSTPQIVGTIRATDAALRGAGVHPMSLVRPPYGAVDGEVKAASRRTRHPIVLWDVDPRDWDGRSTDQIASSVLAQLRSGRRNIVLLHDGVANSPRTAAAVPRIISAARGRGFCFVGLNERGQPGFPTPMARLVVNKKDLHVREGQDLVAKVRLSAPAGRVTTVRVALTRGTASLRHDLGRATKIARVPAGKLSAKVRIPILRDRLDEPKERFNLGLRPGLGVRVKSQSLTATIEDADPAPKISGNPIETVEPGTGTAYFPVSFTLNRPSGRDVRLHLVTVAGTADETDYVAINQSVTIRAGQTSATVEVTVRSDAVIETDESFVVRVLAARRAEVGRPDAVVTIKATAP